ncbi:hypothetical protein M1O54_07635 [Dehalococcoidia bacterium]|nr:hypothetical protein [Dehalococcoidia bacterium]
MKRRSQYPGNVIAYALAQRSNRAKWKEIQDGIRREFGIKPPSDRQMREWCKEFGGGSNEPESILRQTLVEMTKASAPWAAFTTQKFVIDQVSTIVDAWKRGEKPWIVGGIIIMSVFEEMVGSEMFDEILRRYEEGRAGRKEKLVGWINLPAIERMSIPFPMLGQLEEVKHEGSAVNPEVQGVEERR